MEENLIFLIDDDLMSNVFNTMMIRKKHPDISISSFTSVEEAFADLKNDANRKPMLIFLDLNMPVLNGWDFLEEFNRLSFEIDIAILTSSNDMEDMTRAKEFKQIKHYIIKPISLELLDKVMGRYK
jgi:response regulator of citrate/malate metabolism